jgi:hypothetical protein
MHWLYRPGTPRLLWIGFAIVLALTVVAGFFVDLHPHFAFESLPAFFALYGFGACVILVVGSRLVGMLLKRRDSYYER